jgi:hypothetical protein
MPQEIVTDGPSFVGATLIVWVLLFVQRLRFLDSLAIVLSGEKARAQRAPDEFTISELPVAAVFGATSMAAYAVLIGLRAAPHQVLATVLRLLHWSDRLQRLDSGDVSARE